MILNFQPYILITIIVDMFIDIKIELDVMIQDSRQSKHLNFKVKNNSTRALNQHQSQCLLYNSRWSKLILQVLSWCQTSVLILIPMMASTELKTKHYSIKYLFFAFGKD